VNAGEEDRKWTSRSWEWGCIRSAASGIGRVKSPLISRNLRTRRRRSRRPATACRCACRLAGNVDCSPR
jgi:hypothetical protein